MSEQKTAISRRGVLKRASAAGVIAGLQSSGLHRAAMAGALGEAAGIHVIEESGYTRITGSDEDRAQFARLAESAKSLPAYRGVVNVEELRAGTVAFANGPLARPVSADIKMTPVDAGGVSCVWFETPRVRKNASVLYFHGGGYVAGSIEASRGIAASLCESLNAPVLAVGYRQAPEAPFPAAKNDALASYEWLTRNHSGAITIAGDSAGGTLAIVLAQQAALRGLPKAVAVIAASPWFDLSMSGDSWERFRGRDLVTPELGAYFVSLYLGGAKTIPEGASVSYSDFSDLPPILIQMGGVEGALDDALRWAEAARESGADVTVEVYSDMPHNFGKFANPIADLTYARMRDWRLKIIDRI